MGFWDMLLRIESGWEVVWGMRKGARIGVLTKLVVQREKHVAGDLVCAHSDMGQ